MALPQFLHLPHLLLEIEVLETLHIYLASVSSLSIYPSHHRSQGQGNFSSLPLPQTPLLPSCFASTWNSRVPA